MLPRRPRPSGIGPAPYDRYLGYEREELDAQYDVEAHQGAAATVVRQLCDRLSEEARARLSPRLDLACEPGAAACLDLFPADRPGAPVFVFLPGASWRAVDRRAAAYAALGLVARGAAVAVLGHEAIGATGMARVLDGICRAVLWLHEAAPSFNGDPARVALVGHGSGGHLAALAPTADWRRLTGREDATCPLAAIAALSGVFDLEPVRRSFLNVDLGLDAAAVAPLSPLRLVPALPRPAPRFLLAVGSRESDEFHRHLATYARALEASGTAVTAVTLHDRHHAAVAADLAAPSSEITNRLIALTGTGATADTSPI